MALHMNRPLALAIREEEAQRGRHPPQIYPIRTFAEQVARSAERSDASNFGRSDQVCSDARLATLDFELVCYFRLETVG